MNKYRITDKSTGKERIYRGETCEEAMGKFSNRMVFGNPMVYNAKLKILDADTRGKEWALYEIDGAKGIGREEVIVELVEGENSPKE